MDVSSTLRDLAPSLRQHHEPGIVGAPIDQAGRRRIAHGLLEQLAIKADIATA